MPIYRTFAESEVTVRTLAMIRRGTSARRLPAGPLHAVAGAAATTLCGVDIADLVELGRSRYPFERLPADRRCPQCNKLAEDPLGP